MDFARTGGGYRHPTTSTWGANIIRNGTTFHMWLAECVCYLQPIQPPATRSFTLFRGNPTRRMKPADNGL